MLKGKVPSIPAPAQTLPSLQQSLDAVKQTVDLMVGQTGKDNMTTVVTFQDLVNLGILAAAKVPKK